MSLHPGVWRYGWRGALWRYGRTEKRRSHTLPATGCGCRFTSSSTWWARRRSSSFSFWTWGDIIGVSGELFRTKTNELTVRVERLELLSKALLPLPEKWHGLADVEMRYRRRYLDLIVNDRAREIFLRRAQILRELRRFFDERGYVEVETPMMHSIRGRGHGETLRDTPQHVRHGLLSADRAGTLLEEAGCGWNGPRL